MESDSATLCHSWAVQLLKDHGSVFANNGLSVEHFKLLCEQPNLCEALLAATKQISSFGRCREVKLNLKLHALKKSWTSNGDTIQSLKEQVLNKKAAVLEAEADLANAVKLLSDTTIELNDYEREAHQCRQRSILLESVGVQAVTDTELSRNLKQSTSSLLEDWQSRLSREVTEPTAKFEASLMNFLHDVQQLRHSLLSNEIADDTLRESRENLYMQASRLASELSAGYVVSVMSRLAECEALHMQNGDLGTAEFCQPTTQQPEDAASLDSDAYAEKPDKESREPEGEKAVEQEDVTSLVALMSAAHAKYHLLAAEQESAAAAHSAARDSIASTAGLAVKHQHGDSESAEVISGIVKHSVTVAGQRAALQHLQDTVIALKQQAEAVERQHAVLAGLQSSVLASDKQLRCQLHRLQCLHRSVERGRNAFQEQREVALTAAAATLQQLSYSPAPPCLDTVCREVELLDFLPITHLCAVGEHDDVSVRLKDVSICTEDTTVDMKLRKILDEVVEGASSSLSSECLSAEVLAASTEVRTLEVIAQQSAAAKSARTSVPALAADSIRDLCARVDASDEHLESSVTAALDTCEQRLRSGEETIPRTARAITNWWEQPCKAIKL